MKMLMILQNDLPLSIAEPGNIGQKSDYRLVPRCLKGGEEHLVSTFSIHFVKICYVS